MKATISFNLPEDREDFDFALNGVEYYLTIKELDDWLRGLAKYENKETVKIHEVRARLRERVSF
jgi:hypothetical protein